MFKEKKADLVALVDFKFRVPIVDGFAHCVQVIGGAREGKGFVRTLCAGRGRVWEETGFSTLRAGRGTWGGERNRLTF